MLAQSALGLLQRVELLARRSQLRRDLCPLEGDGVAFGVVLVVADGIG